MPKTRKTPGLTKPSPKAAPPRYAALKKIALRFPGAEEVWFRGDPWFNVGRKSFALYSTTAGKWIFKLPKPQQMMLFDARPQTFTPMRAGLLLWSYVVVENLDTAELTDLLTAAWKTIVTKKVQMLYDSEPRGRR